MCLTQITSELLHFIPLASYMLSKINGDKSSKVPARYPSSGSEVTAHQKPRFMQYCTWRKSCKKTAFKLSIRTLVLLCTGQLYDLVYGPKTFTQRSCLGRMPYLTATVSAAGMFADRQEFGV